MASEPTTSANQRAPAFPKFKPHDDVPIGFRAFETHLAMRRHFVDMDYDFLKYAGKLKAGTAIKAYKNAGACQIHYAKIERSFPNLRGFFLSNLIHNPYVSIHTLMETPAKKTYFAWQGRLESITVCFSNEISVLFPKRTNTTDADVDLAMLASQTHSPALFNSVLGRRISPETLLILDGLYGLSDKWTANGLVRANPMWGDWKLRLHKYKSFLKLERQNHEKYLSIIELCVGRNLTIE